MYRADEELVLSPSDLNNFVECPHLTSLDKAYADGDRDHEPSRSAQAELLGRKGDEHETAYLQGLKDQGLEVVEIDEPEDRSLAALRACVEQTAAAMRNGAEVIYQATFFQERFRGHADFLFRIEDRPSELGSYSYEVADTKLAKRAKPYFILQLCFYSEMVAAIQGAEPEQIHIVLGDGSQQSYRLAEFSAYFRRVRARFQHTLDTVADTYPDPVGHCAICRWSDRCDERRVDDDHLSLVANITRGHIEKLASQGITRLEELGRLDAPSGVPGIRPEMLDRLRDQAALQLKGRNPDGPVLRLLEPDEKRGFARLPRPSAGDIFFDMEGDPFFDGGLEYLFGLITNENGKPKFTALWGKGRIEERAALEQFVDLVCQRREQWPDLHIYHYAHYEATALKRLAGAHGTREEELDQLLRDEVFVDLYRVVRESMRTSQPSYGLKKIEAFYMEQRQTSVTDGNDSVVEFERWLDAGDDAILDQIAAYNEKDCVSTLLLRDWLIKQKATAESEHGAPIPFFEGHKEEPGAEEPGGDTETAALRATLTEGLPEDPAERDPAQLAVSLLAHTLDYHHREARPVWWAFFDRIDRNPDELIDDVDCIGGLEPKLGAEPEDVKRSKALRMSFPPQETKMGDGGGVADLAATKPGLRIRDFDLDGRELDVIRGPGHAENAWPKALIPGGPYQTTEQRGALRRLAAHVAEHGLEGSGPYRACRDLLLANAPRVVGHDPDTPLHGDPAQLEELKTVVRALDDSCLMIQGPPGSGKTWSGARLIVDLIDRKQRVGVTSTSHKAIHNLLEEIDEVAEEAGVEFKGLKKCDPKREETSYESDRFDSTGDNSALTDPDVAVPAGTAWHFCREEVDGTLDYLFIDEAGQISLADALALGTSARNIVLLGDPQQLPQVTQAAHPEASDVSVLEHLLRDRQTIPPTEGVFLGQTWRMHPDVCEFVSELMYDGRLESAPGRELQGIDASGELTGTGIRWLPTEHAGNAQSSNEEATRIAEAIKELDGAAYTDEEGAEHPLTLEEILVVAPFNAQVKLLEQHLPEGARIGTADKFQGQEAQLVFFSMATSSGEEVPRGMEFLFSRNRLNVAISRARAQAVLVCSPALLDLTCNSIEQMRLVNAVCRIAEIADRSAR